MIRIDLSPGQLRAVLAIVGRYVEQTAADSDCLIYQAERELDSALLAYETQEEEMTS